MKEFLDVSLFGGAVLSLVGYEIGLILKKKFKMAVFNPLLIGVISVIAVLVVGNISYESYNQSGKYISYLLTPATVCLAVPLYEQLELLKKNLKAVAAGLISGVLASLVGVLILAKLFGLNGIWLSLLAAEAVTFLTILFLAYKDRRKRMAVV